MLRILKQKMEDSNSNNQTSINNNLESTSQSEMPIIILIRKIITIKETNKNTSPFITIFKSIFLNKLTYIYIYMANFSSVEILSFEIIGGVFISGIIYYVYNKSKKLNKDIDYLNDMLSLNPEDRESILKSSRRLESHRKGGTRKISRKKKYS